MDYTVYFICTGQVYLEELKAGAIVDTWQVHGFEECGARKPIKPGDHHIFKIPTTFSFFSPDRRMPRYDSSVSYRLRVDLYQDSNFQKPLSPALAVSNTFRLTVDSEG